MGISHTCTIAFLGVAPAIMCKRAAVPLLFGDTLLAPFSDACRVFAPLVLLLRRIRLLRPAGTQGAHQAPFTQNLQPHLPGCMAFDAVCDLLRPFIASQSAMRPSSTPLPFLTQYTLTSSAVGMIDPVRARDGFAGPVHASSPCTPVSVFSFWFSFLFWF